MNRKDEALRIAWKGFQIIRFGGHLEPSEAKIFGDLCALALPMKYRWTKEEIDSIKRGVELTLAVGGAHE